VLLPTDARHAAPPDAVLSACRGLLLSSGGHIPAAYFEATPNPSLRDTNPGRYDYELPLVRAARQRAMPVLGICRGHQTLVEALGGHVGNLGRLPSGEWPHRQRVPHPDTTHPLHARSGTLLARACGPRSG